MTLAFTYVCVTGGLSSKKRAPVPKELFAAPESREHEHAQLLVWRQRFLPLGEPVGANSVLASCSARVRLLPARPAVLVC